MNKWLASPSHWGRGECLLLPSLKVTRPHPAPCSVPERTGSGRSEARPGRLWLG